MAPAFDVRDLEAVDTAAAGEGFTLREVIRCPPTASAWCSFGSERSALPAAPTGVQRRQPRPRCDLPCGEFMRGNEIVAKVGVRDNRRRRGVPIAREAVDHSEDGFVELSAVVVSGSCERSNQLSLSSINTSNAATSAEFAPTRTSARVQRRANTAWRSVGRVWPAHGKRSCTASFTRPSEWAQAQ